ncbi:MAG: tetratricopeptide repeat protein [Bacteroidales bacterium]|nr:tetratricopeptide repeat protein [Bacteroidales bacterium]
MKFLSVINRSTLGRYVNCPWMLISAFTVLIMQSTIGFSQLDSLQIVIETTFSQREKAVIFNQLADKNLDKDIVVAQKYADSARVIGYSLSDYNIISNAYVNLANSYYFQGDLDSALYFFEKSYYSISKTKNKNEIAAALNRLGLGYEAKSDYSTAAGFYYKALAIYEETQNHKGLAEVLNNIAVISDALDLKEEALEYYYKSLKYFDLAKNREGMANVYNNIATHYVDKGNTDTASYYLEQAIKIFIEYNRTSEAATAYLNAASLYQEVGKNKLAKNYIDSALIFYEYTNNIHGIANVYSEEAKRLTQKGDFSNAIKLLSKSLILREEVGNLNAQTQLLKQISDVYAQNGDFENALVYYQKHVSLRDSILDDNTKTLISELNIKYETVKKDKEITILKKETQIKNTNNYLLILIISALVIIVALLFFFLRTKIRLLSSQKEYYEQLEEYNRLKLHQQESKRQFLEKEIDIQQQINEFQKNKFETELELSKRELVTTTMQVLNKNKTLTEIKEHLISLISSDPANKKAYKGLSRLISDNINLDSDWEQFKMHFEKVNVGFFDNLQQTYPELSQGDLKVCAYIKIKLSSKEIAQMMNISVAGINKRLYRIRKKMQLEPHSNIAEHLDTLTNSSSAFPNKSTN